MEILEKTFLVTSVFKCEPFLKELCQHIADDSPEKQREGIEILEDLETAIQSPSQSQSRIKRYLKEPCSFVKDTGKDLFVSIGKELIKEQLGLPK